MAVDNSDQMSGSAESGEEKISNPFEMVQEIEKILAGDPDDREVGEDSIEFPLRDALALIPHRYVKDVDPEEIYGETVLVTPADLYEQLARGKVTVSLSQLAYYIPLHLIYHGALNQEETAVELPLKKVVKAVGLEQLKRRTPENFRMYDISVFDDPFKEGTASLTDDVGLVFDDEEEAGEASEPAALLLDDEPETLIDEHEDEVAIAAPESELPSEPAAPAEDAPALSARIVHEGSIGLTLSGLLRALPDGLAPEECEEAIVDVEVPDLLNQLRKGVVTMSLSALVDSLPDGILKNSGSIDRDAVVTLDLRETVKALGLEALKEQTPAAARSYDIEWMADPFEESDVKPDLEAVRVLKKEQKLSEAAAKPSVTETQPSPKVTVYQPTRDGDSEVEYYELPGNININAASADELMVLKGVGRHIADAIVAYRDKHHGFKSVFDLFKVDGIDEVRFRQMTGMKSEHKRRHRRKRLASMLRIPPASVGNLTVTAQAIARKSGFMGCLISDLDGLVLAQSGLNELADNLSAILPGMLGGITHGMNLAGLKISGTVTIAVSGQLYTIQAADNVILSAAHAENMVSESDLSFMRKVGRELAWLLSVRAYAGPMA